MKQQGATAGWPCGRPRARSQRDAQPRRAYTEAPESKACLDQWRPTDNIILLNERDAQPRRAYTEAPESKACLDQWRPTDNIILLNEVVLMVLFFFNISDKDIIISDKDIE